jgi:integrase
MSRRSGQNGYIEKSGNWYVIRFWMDVPGQDKREHVREKICPISGLGSLTESARRRRGKEIVAGSGADSVEHFERAFAADNRTTFRQQAEWWLTYMRDRKRKPLASSTYSTWRSCLDKWLNPSLGELPLPTVDNDPVKKLVQEMVDAGLGPKTIIEYTKVVKAIVASAKDAKTRKQLYPIAWDEEYLDLPLLDKKKQKRPRFASKTITDLVAGATKTYVKMIYVVAASAGMRIGEVLGLEIDKHFADDFRTISVRQQVRKCCVQHTLKTSNAEREVDLHSSVAELLKEYVGSRTSGLLFCSRNGKPLSESNIRSRHLHPALKKLAWRDLKSGAEKAGHHAFRRFRLTWLRENRVPADLERFWIGHANETIGDDYSGLKENILFRKKIAEEIGVGFEIPSSVVPKVPNVPKTAVGVSVEVAVNC